MLFSKPSVLLFASLAAAQNALVDYLSSQEDLSTLLDLLTIVPEVAETLAAAENITILAPTNQAFANVPPDTQESLSIETRDPNGTATILNYHVIRGGYPSSAFEETPFYYPTLFDSRSIIFDTPRTNVTGGQNVGLFRDGDNFQTISGELQTNNVVEADIEIGSIIIHKIDDVLFIPLNLTETTERTNATALRGALNETGLLETLDIVPDLTIFIPNNEAFRNAASAFEGASIETLIDVLQYHAIVGSVVFSTDIANTTVEAANGGTLTLTVLDDEIYVNTARVLLPNILMSNGVAHVIDTVLNPATEGIDLDDLDDDAEVAFPGATPTGGVPFVTFTPTTINTVPPIATSARPVNETSTQPTAVPTFTGAAAMPTAMGALFAGAAFVGAMELGF